MFTVQTARIGQPDAEVITVDQYTRDMMMSEFGKTATAVTEAGDWWMFVFDNAADDGEVHLAVIRDAK
jgi:hypothetical protein